MRGWRLATNGGRRSRVAPRAIGWVLATTFGLVALATCAAQSEAAEPAVAPPSDAASIQSESPVLPALNPGEQISQFTNGCGYISTGNRPTGKMYWYGSCRFGLAHGNGYMMAEQGTRSQRRYQYGVLLGTTAGYSSATPYSQPASDGVYLSMLHENGDRDWVNITSPGQNVATLTAGHEISLAIKDGATSVVDTFRSMKVACTTEGKVDWKGATIAAADAAAADADCAIRPTSGMFGQLAAALAHGDRGYIEHSHWTRPVGGAASPKEISIRYCPDGSASASCTRILHEMLQPFAARMQSVIDGQRRQYAEGLPWLIAHYAPLEQARRTRMNAAIARYLARPRPAPAAADAPRPPLRKGKRQ